MADDNFIKIAILENAFEAQVVESVLKEEEIPHSVRSYHDTAYDGLFQFQKGWGEIQAPETYQTEILRIIDQIREHTQNSGD